MLLVHPPRHPLLDHLELACAERLPSPSPRLEQPLLDHLDHSLLECLELASSERLLLEHPELACAEISPLREALGNPLLVAADQVKNAWPG